MRHYHSPNLSKPSVTQQCTCSAQNPSRHWNQDAPGSRASLTGRVRGRGEWDGLSYRITSPPPGLDISVISHRPKGHYLIDVDNSIRFCSCFICLLGGGAFWERIRLTCPLKRTCYPDRIKFGKWFKRYRPILWFISALNLKIIITYM